MVVYDWRNSTVTSTCWGAYKRSLLCLAATGSTGAAEEAARDTLRAFVIASVLIETVARICVTALINVSVF